MEKTATTKELDAQELERLSEKKDTFHTETEDLSGAEQSIDDQPRKRSKVSRACDSCRRKKIRCNGEYSTNLERVTKICTSCSKTKEPCTFSRVPLKRGPSKGYNRDSEDKSDKLKSSLPDVKPPPHSLPFPQTSHLPKSMMTGRTISASPPIMLPPLLNINNSKSKLISKVNGHTSNPSSPRSNSIHEILNRDTQPHSAQAPPIVPPSQAFQGPFWKVPYEMPLSGSVGGNENNRRFSLDSCSSISSTASQYSKNSLKPGISIVVNDNYSTDSDADDYFSANSSRRQSTQSLSPRNSISSMSSLNGRINRSLSFQSPQLSQSQMSPQSNTSIYFPPKQILPSQLMIRQAVSVENNLRVYYTKFHSCFPALPFNEHLTSQLLNISGKEELKGPFFENFHDALSNLINYGTLHYNDSMQIFSKVLSMDPTSNVALRVDESSIILFFSALVLTNYAALLSGNINSMGIAMTFALLNDFKVLENFHDIVSTTSASADYDDVRLILPRLYYLNTLIDGATSLIFGVQRQASNPILGTLRKNVNYILPADERFLGLMDILIGASIDDIISQRDSILLDNSPKEEFASLKRSHNNEEKITLISCVELLFESAFEIQEYIFKIEKFLRKPVSSNHADQEDFLEVVNDDQLKLLRLIKKVTGSILSYSNFINDIVVIPHPFLGLYFSISLKMIKMCKLVIDGSMRYGDKRNGDVLSRCSKINNDLLAAFNTTDLSLRRSLLGAVSMNSFRNKIDNYQMNFSFLVGSDPGSKPAYPNYSTVDKHIFNLWKLDFLNNVVPFVTRELFNA